MKILQTMVKQLKDVEVVMEINRHQFQQFQRLHRQQPSPVRL